MQLAPVGLVVLASSILSWSALASKVPRPRSAQTLQDKDAHDGHTAAENLSLAQLVQDPGGNLPRPNDGGPPDFVYFRMLVREFMGVNELMGLVNYDLVLSYTWKDPRASQLVPSGKEKANVAADTPLSKMWNPNIVITSIDFDGLETLGNTILVSKDGTVEQVRRMLYQGKNKFDVTTYPFDRQTLTVMITSGTHMMEEVKLAVITNMSTAGVGPVAFDGSPFVVTNTSIWEFEEISGPLRKSRGRFDIVVQRKWLGPLKKLAYPQVLLMLQAYSVFYLPFALFAVMPRVATVLIAFLSLMSVHASQSATVPPPAGASWIELFNLTIMQLIVAMLLLNVFILTVAYEWKDEPLATMVNKHMRMGFAGVSAVMLLVCAVGSFGVGLSALLTLNITILWAFNIGYIYWVFQLRAEKEKKEQEAAAAAAAATPAPK